MEETNGGSYWRKLVVSRRIYESHSHTECIFRRFVFGFVFSSFDLVPNGIYLPSSKILNWFPKNMRLSNGFYVICPLYGYYMYMVTIWSYMFVYGRIRSYMVIYVATWSYEFIYGHIWSYIHGRIW